MRKRLAELYVDLDNVYRVATDEEVVSLLEDALDSIRQAIDKCPRTDDLPDLKPMKRAGGLSAGDIQTRK